MNLNYKSYFLKYKNIKFDSDILQNIYYVKIIRYNYISDPKKYFYNIFFMNQKKETLLFKTDIKNRYTKLTDNLENKRYINRYFEILEIKKGVLSD